MIAEASNTTLLELTLRRLAPFGDQFVHKGHARLYILPDMPLSALDSPLHCGNADLIILPAENDFVTGLNSKRPAEFQWNHDAAIVVDCAPNFCGTRSSSF